MNPQIYQINISAGGIPKRPIDAGQITFNRMDGDGWNDRTHHGLPGQALCLFSLELIEALREEGYPLFPGALGENLTTRHLDFHTLRLGDIFAVGNEALIRITKVRVPCRTITVYGEGIMRATYDERVQAGDVHSPKWGRSGYYAEVLREGWIRPGDPIIVHTQRGNVL